MRPEKARENAIKVYRTLLRQGRPETDARRDAEAWVKGNYGVEVLLETIPPTESAEIYNLSDAQMEGVADYVRKVRQGMEGMEGMERLWRAWNDTQRRA